MDWPRISIVTPSFDQADLLELTLRSVLDQRYPNLEFIVIDGGSTDGSVDVIRRYEERLAFWCSERDAGHADAINKGFTHATGEIMAWINSSDGYYPWTLETVAEMFHDVPDAQWIMGLPSLLDCGNAPRRIVPSFFNVYDFLARQYYWIQQESVFWRRSLWEASGGTMASDVKLACDLELWFRFFRVAPLYHASTILAGFRIHGEQRSNTSSAIYVREAEEAYRAFVAGFGARDRRRARIVGALHGPAGRAVRKWMSGSSRFSWYMHPRIERDLAAHRWVVS